MKISVIIPVYNAEKYLDRCLFSVCNQTHRDIEVLVINDGSKDNSLEKCYAHAQKDPRIQVFTKENEGQGKARNVGLDHAKGDYVCFVDSDDYIHLQMLELLAQAAEQHEADLVQCQYVEVEDGEEVEKKQLVYDESEILLTREEGGEFLCYYTDDIIPVNKLIKRELLRDLRFPEGMFYEDKHLMFRLRYYAQKIVYLNVPLYYYVQSPNSTMRNKTDEKRLRSSFRLMEELSSFCQEKGLLADYNSETAGYLRTLLSIYYRTKNEPEFSAYHQKCIAMMKRFLPEWKKNPYIVGKYRWIVRLMCVNFNFALFVFCTMNKARKRKGE